MSFTQKINRINRIGCLASEPSSHCVAPLRNKGFTLIELMVAMILGLLVVLIVTQFMLTSRQTYSTTREYGRVQETARYALDEMSAYIRMAGFSVNGENPAFFYTGLCATGGSSETCSNDGTGSTGMTLSDQIAVLTNPIDDNGDNFNDGDDTDDLAEDCTNSDGAGSSGEINPSSFHQVANVFYIGVNGSVSSLYCRGYNVTTLSWVSNAIPLIDGIDGLQVQYGMTDATGTRYMPATAVTDWTAIVAVKIQLLASTGDAESGNEFATRSYQLLDSAAVSYTDSFNRQVFSTTVRINNAAI
jgi:type IV pilus assembly protein PilW